MNTDQRLLMRREKVIPITPKVFDTLLVLVERAGRVVEKTELMNLLWPDTFVEESNLTFNISTLRKALGKNSENGQYIETIPRRGYRFVASIREIQAETAGLVYVEDNGSQATVEQMGKWGPDRGRSRSLGNPFGGRHTKTHYGFSWY